MEAGCFLQQPRSTKKQEVCHKTISVWTKKKPSHVKSLDVFGDAKLL